MRITQGNDVAGPQKMLLYCWTVLSGLSGGPVLPSLFSSYPLLFLPDSVELLNGSISSEVLFYFFQNSKRLKTPPYLYETDKCTKKPTYLLYFADDGSRSGCYLQVHLWTSHVMCHESTNSFTCYLTSHRLQNNLCINMVLF